MATLDASQVVPGAAFDTLVELVHGLQLPPVEAFHVAEAVVPLLEMVVNHYADAHKTVLHGIASMRSGWSCLASAASFAPSRAAAVQQSSRGASLPAAASSPDADLDVAALRSQIEHGNDVIAELRIQNENAKQQIEQLQQQVQELSAECQARIEGARNENEKLQLQVSELQALLSRAASEPHGALAIQSQMDSNADIEAATPSEGKAAAEASASERAAAAASIVGKPDVFEAAQSGNIKLVKDHVMADAGCLLKADSSGWTALMHSSSRGHLDVTRFLVESGANLEAKSKRGWTALIFSNGLDITRFLVESKADVAAKDTENGKTALKYAIECGESDIVAYLRSIGAP